MSKNTFNKLLKEFKKNQNLDFRIHKYLKNSNSYNFKPSVYFDYDFAEKIVLELNNFLIEKFQEKLVIYNLEMDIEKIRNTTLRHYLECRIQDYLDTYKHLNNKI